MVVLVFVMVFVVDVVGRLGLVVFVLVVINVGRKNLYLKFGKIRSV